MNFLHHSTFFQLLVVFLLLLVFCFIYLSNRDSKNRYIRVYEKVAEIWIPFLQYCMDSAYDILYAKHLTTYVASNTIMRISDAEFSELSKNYFSLVKMFLGKLYKEIYISYIFGNEEKFLDFLNTNLIRRVYRDLAENVATTVEKQEE